MYIAQDSYRVCFISIQGGRAYGQLSCPETAGNPLRLGTALLSGAGPDLGDDGRTHAPGAIASAVAGPVLPAIRPPAFPLPNARWRCAGRGPISPSSTIFPHVKETGMDPSTLLF